MQVVAGSMTKLISKQLTKSDIQKSLLIPTCSFGALPFEGAAAGGHFFDIDAIDKTGKSWNFPCFVQQAQGIGIESSVVSVGWLQFLSGKDVRAGDMVVLHQKSKDDNNSSATQLKIEVKRKIRLMGEDIWAVVD